MKILEKFLELSKVSYIKELYESGMSPKEVKNKIFSLFEPFFENKDNLRNYINSPFFEIYFFVYI